MNCEACHSVGILIHDEVVNQLVCDQCWRKVRVTDWHRSGSNHFVIDAVLEGGRWSILRAHENLVVFGNGERWKFHIRGGYLPIGDAGIPKRMFDFLQRVLAFPDTLELDKSLSRE